MGPLVSCTHTLTLTHTHPANKHMGTLVQLRCCFAETHARIFLFYAAHKKKKPSVNTSHSLHHRHEAALCSLYTSKPSSSGTSAKHRCLQCTLSVHTCAVWGNPAQSLCHKARSRWRHNILFMQAKKKKKKSCCSQNDLFGFPGWKFTYS